MEQVIENQEQMRKQVDNLKQRIKAMASDQEHMKAMMEALIRHHDINVEEDDVSDEI